MCDFVCEGRKYVKMEIVKKLCAWFPPRKKNVKRVWNLAAVNSEENNTQREKKVTKNSNNLSL